MIVGPMKYLTYVHGNVARPKSFGPQIIAHICNDVGIWFGESARNISRHWPEAERAYHHWYCERASNEFGLGAVQFVNVNRTHVNRVIRVANMVAQRGTNRHRIKARPVRYQTIARCLTAVARKAIHIGASIHLPRICMDKAEANWSEIESMILTTLCDRSIPVYIYDSGPTLGEQMIALRVLRPRTRPRFELFEAGHFD